MDDRAEIRERQRQIDRACRRSEREHQEVQSRGSEKAPRDRGLTSLARRRALPPPQQQNPQRSHQRAGQEQQQPTQRRDFRGHCSQVDPPSRTNEYGDDCARCSIDARTPRSGLGRLAGDQLGILYQRREVTHRNARARRRQSRGCLLKQAPCIGEPAIGARTGNRAQVEVARPGEQQRGAHISAAPQRASSERDQRRARHRQDGRWKRESQSARQRAGGYTQRSRRDGTDDLAAVAILQRNERRPLPPPPAGTVQLQQVVRRQGRSGCVYKGRGAVVHFHFRRPAGQRPQGPRLGEQRREVIAARCGRLRDWCDRRL